MQRILVLMFHRIYNPLQKGRLAQFEAFLDYLSKNYAIVLPNEPIPRHKPAVCLTFDDAYFDFYHYVFPLLKKRHLKALLAVPVQAIAERCYQSPRKRLELNYLHHNAINLPRETSPLCTWEEIQEMAESNQVMMASHGYQHADLTEDNTNFEEEIVISKQVLEKRINQSIDTFVYPFGRMTPPIHRNVRKHYQFGFRIGNAVNFGWQNQAGLIYRVNADPFWLNQKKLHTPKQQCQLLLKYCSNRLRRR